MAVTASQATNTAQPTAARPVPSLPTPALLDQPTLSVVIVNFCQWNNTARLVRQLQASGGSRTGEAEVVVIDNHSPPHVAMERLRRSEGVSLRRFSRNRGFARGVNEGCRLSRGNWLLVLNPDMSAEPDFLDAALEVLRKVEAEQPRAGVIGFRLLHDDGSPQASVGRFPTLTNTLLSLARPRRVRKCRHVEADSRTPVAWVTGCCLLIRRECLDDLGGFDENFFLYYEDVDLCRRAREAGWSVWFEPGVELTHHSPLHTRAVPPGLRLITRHALLTYARKHWPGWQNWILSRIVAAEAGWRDRLARWKGHHEGARYSSELLAMVRDLRHGREAEVRARLHRAARRLERTARRADSRPS